MGASSKALALCVGTVLALLACSPSSKAADPPIPNGSANADTRVDAAWEVTVSPFYGWIPGLKGRMGVFGQPPVNIDVTPIEIIQNIDEFLNILEGVYIGSGQVRRGDLGLMWDVVYFDIRAVSQIGNDLIGGPLDVGFAATKATLAGTYRVHDTARSHIDILAGARITDIDLTVGVDLGLIGEASDTDGETWVDPIFGVRGRTHVTERIYLDSWAIVGGFGIESDFLWDAYGVVGYEIKDWLSAYAGYRGSKTDYRNGAFIWDVTLHGPIVGFELAF